MWKWTGWAARLIATALLLSFLSIWTTGYIVNSYMETLLKQLDLPLQTQPFALSGVWGKLWGASDVRESEGGEASRAPDVSPEPSLPSKLPPSSEPAAEPLRQNPGGGGLSPGGTEASASPSPDAPGEDGAVPVFGGGTNFMEMTDQQRQTLQAVMAKLNGDQLGQLSTLLEDGLTADELDQVIGMLEKSSLTEAELEPFIELLRKRATGGNESPSPSP